MQKMLPFSKKERIIPSETTKDQVSIFGENPEKNWCYYFQKASLARQSENWQEIIRLYNQTQEDRLSPRNAAEFIPFIEAFIAEKRWDEAVTLTEIARKPRESPYYPLENYLCKTWERFGSKVNQKESQNQISNEMKKLGCQTQAE